MVSEKHSYTLTKYGCYFGYISMAVTSSISPLLFLTFRQMYGFTYTMLGLLVVVNFFTQLGMDIIFTVFAKYFNIKKTVRLTPAITALGLIIYAVLPNLFPNAAYFWIVTGTFVFSMACGLSEVFLSPTIATIPSDNPEYEMTKLHSVFAWGSVAVVIFSTLVLKIIGTENWMYLVLVLTAVPICNTVMFAKARIPHMQAEGAGGKSRKGVKLGIFLCVLCVFLGGATECGMSQWMSGFAERVIGIPKVWGDIIGMAGFAVLLGLGRTIYAKYGKNIINVMLIGTACAMVCYICAALSGNPIIGITACAGVGLFTAMLWPGTIIYVGEKFPGIGINMYALIAAGGDMGVAVSPQLVGIISDKFPLTQIAQNISQAVGETPEQIGMRAGILFAAIFPGLGIMVILAMKRYFKNK